MSFVLSSNVSRYHENFATDFECFYFQEMSGECLGISITIKDCVTFDFIWIKSVKEFNFSKGVFR